MKTLYLFILLLLSACSSIPESNLTAVEESKPQEWPTYKKVYYLQHKILPEWTFTSDGEFYSDLIKGDLSRLQLAASDVVSPSYANAITSEVIVEDGAVLIVFPTPKAYTNCYYVLIQKTADSFKYYTYEKTMNFGDDDTAIGVVGIWSSEGSHGNLGARAYIKSSDFVADVLDSND